MKEYKKRKLLLRFLYSFFLIHSFTVFSQSICDSTVHNGHASYYNLIEKGNGGNCSFKNEFVKPYYGAVSNSFYKGSQSCGVCLELTGRGGSEIIQVIDRCPGCGKNDIDLSPQAYQKIMGSMSGVNNSITWYEVTCPWSGEPLSVKTIGANTWFVKLFVYRAKNRIKSVEIKANGKWLPMKRGNDNGWSAGSLGGYKSYEIRVTDVFGQQVSGITINPRSPKTYYAEENFIPCIGTKNFDYEKFRQVTYHFPSDNNLVEFDDVINIKKIEIHNLLGELVFDQIYLGTANKIQADLDCLPNGSYTVSLYTESPVLLKVYYSSIYLK